MAVPWQIMNKIRKTVMREVGQSDDWFVLERTGEKVQLADRFFTLDRKTNQIVSNVKICGSHFIFDQEGNLINVHRD